MENLKKYFTWTLLIGVAIFVLLMYAAPAFAMFGEALIYVSAFLLLFVLFDKHVMKSINTIAELKKGNIAYALFLIAIAIVFLAVATLVG